MMDGGIERRDIPSHQPGVRRQPANGHIQNQYDDMRERNRLLRQKLQALQSERDSAIEDSQQMWTKMDQMQKQMQKMASSMGKGQMSWMEQENMAKKVEAISAQNQLLQARYKEDVQSLKNALEDAEQDRDNLRYKLSESKRENDKLSEKLSCLGPNYDTSRRQIEAVIAQRDKLKKQVDGLDRDLRAAKEKLASSGGSSREEPQRESAASKAELSDLKVEASRLRQENQSVVKDRDRLAEENGELRSKVEQMESRVHSLETECKRLRDSSPVRGLGRMGGAAMRGSSEDLLAIRSRGQRSSLPYKKFSPSSADEDSDRSLQDLTSLNHSGDLSFAKKKLSSSTSNLTTSSDGGVPTRLSEANSRLRSRLVRSDQALDDLQRDNVNLGAKVTKLEKERTEMELQTKRLKQELHTAQLELNKTGTQVKEAQTQIQMLCKEKGVAMRDNAVSYKQSIQLESKLRELETERQILQQQRDIANKEREKVVMESVSHKKKLEQIKGQRQKDAKELVTMKHMKDRAVTEMAELRRGNKELQEKIAGMEEEMARIRESISHTSMKLGVHTYHSDSTTSLSSRGRGTQQSSSTAPAGKLPSLSQDLKTLMERLQVAESERNLLHKKLFGLDGLEQGQSASMADVLHKVESLLQERDGLVCEIEALQSSSNKLNEDRIFDLKQRIEDLMMERDTLNAHSKQQKKELSALNAQLINTEQERDRLSIEINRLGLQCQQLKSTQERLVTEHSKTLERVNELWKQKWPGAYDEQAWEEKHITLQLGSDGLAGFSVVGGRDQPQLPNPGAFIVTTVIPGGPADGLVKVGDILESVNGQSMANAVHREAVRAVKESKGSLTVAVRRRRHAHPLVVGIVSAVNSVPHTDITSTAKPEEHNFSLLVTSKDNLGFRYDWESLIRVTEVANTGPAHQILEVGDRILQVNGHSVSHEKPSAVKKLLKPHKNILQLVVKRNSKSHTSHETGQAIFMQEEWSEDSYGGSKRSSIALSSNSTPTYKRRGPAVPETLTQMTSQSPDMESKATGYSSISDKRERERDQGRVREHDHSIQPVQERGSYSSSRDSYSQDLAGTESEDSESKPTKLVSVVTQVKNEAAPSPSSSRQRPVSDGVMYGNFNERRIEYEEVLLSERTESQYSQSESYLSESSSYGDYAGLSSSQSIDLTFHSVSTVTHNRLTVDTMAPTQMEPSHERRGYACADQEDGEEEYFDRLDSRRNAFRSRSNSGENSNTNNSQSQEDSPSQLSDTQLSYPEMSTCSQENGASSHRRRHKGHRGNKFRNKRKANTLHGSSSLTKLSSQDDARSLPPRSGMASSSMGQRGRSWSNLSLSHAPSMTSVIEEPRRSTSTTNVSNTQEQDPLADATYIRANFTYVPRTPKELQIKAGDVFHIHDEAPSERFRSCFLVSRLNSDGTDERMGPIPNSIKAQEYLEAQGESLDIPIYEEVEAYTGTRPVLVFGALADQVVSSLIESYPTMFYNCNTELIEGTARITEARLKREVADRNSKIVDFWRTERGYEVIRLEALTGRENKGKHCLMAGTNQALLNLKSKAPPISILIKAMQYDSIMTFSPEQITEEEARHMFNEIGALEEQFGNEFSASLFLIYMDTLLGQIEDIVKREKRKQSWVAVTRES